MQASAWVVREALDFVPALVLLKEARNVTYKSFIAPGQVLTVESVCKELNADQSVFAANARLDEREIAKGRLTLRHLNLADSDPNLADNDTRIRDHLRALYGLLSVGRPMEAVLD